MITWNGVTSDSIGVIVERMPDRFLPARRFAPHAVPGRNGDVLIVDESFPNIDQVYEVYLSGESRGGMPEVAHAAAAWLTGPKDYAELSDSYEPGGFRRAFFAEGFNIENVLNQFGRCEITFSCAPQFFLDSGRSARSMTVDATNTLTNPTAYTAHPRIYVYGSGTITVGDRVLTVLDNSAGWIIVDCEKMDATRYSNGTSANKWISCLEFPELAPGDNDVVISGFRTVNLVPNWWKL